MSERSFRTFQALLLGALGIFLFSKVMDGRVLLYINRRFVLLVLLGALALIFLAQLVLRERPGPDLDEVEEHHDHGHEHNHRSGWGLFLLALPLLIGLLVPERPLGAQALSTRGVNVFAASGTSGRLGLPPGQRSILDWLREAAADSSGAAYAGQPADVTGFVFYDPRLGKGQFMIGRFTIACCVADASALGLAVQTSGSENLPDNTWVRVRGVMASTKLDGRTVPLILADLIEEIPEPEQPYLFP